MIDFWDQMRPDVYTGPEVKPIETIHQQQQQLQIIYLFLFSVLCFFCRLIFFF